MFKKFFFIPKKIYYSKNRRIILILIDLIIINFSFNLFYEDNLIFFSENLFNKVFCLFLWITIYFFTGQYKSITSFIGSKSIYLIFLRNIFICSLLILNYKIFFDIYGSLESWFSIILFNSFFSGGLRILLRDILLSIKSKKDLINSSKNIIIYGAGINGAQLSKSLTLSKKYNVIGFLDLNKDLWGLEINGLKIFSPDKLNLQNKENTIILLAKINLPISEKRKIFSYSKKYGLEVFERPNIENLVLNDNAINNLKKIEIEDLLCRKPIAPIRNLFGPEIENQIIFITGAGGSIGSEICKQLIVLKPKKLILLEISELNLYTITKDLSSQNHSTKIISILGSACDELLVEKTLSKYKVSILIHAAAYKHVPLVESNPLTGISNNFLSTKILCQSSIKYNVKKMILISSDKAVRPTNVMGASKRLSELIMFYSSSSRSNKKTLFSMVRFGNVLGSSGSVVNLFKEQISKGGPITVTHKNINRYFMTIKEASQLVIQSIALAKGDDLFLLDMGDSIKIENLAKQMIYLSGLTIKDKNNPKGDIEIKITKLREGEKLYEELLINNNSLKTIHPRIFKSNDEFAENEGFEKFVTLLENYLKEQNSDKTLYYLEKLVPEWTRYKKLKLKSNS